MLNANDDANKSLADTFKNIISKLLKDVIYYILDNKKCSKLSLLTREIFSKNLLPEGVT